MYSDCIFCDRAFHRNAAIESLQVGRRIAFDSAKGRLWVVCRRCERWNLVPLESRWEAIEEAERLFRSARLRVSTEQIGLARVKEGTELVRVGRPLRPEFAAWRYGDQFSRRRRNALLLGAGAAAVAGTVVTAGLGAGVSLSVLLQSGHLINMLARHRTVARIPSPEGGVLKVRQKLLLSARFGRYYDGAWYVKIEPPGRNDLVMDFSGPEAERVAALLLPRVNSTGARQRHVAEAVTAIEQRGGSRAFMRHLIEEPPLSDWRRKAYAPERGLFFIDLPRTQRLALEMALHEERERLLLTGELRGLESAWHSAEEVAAIADDLLMPPAIREKMDPDSRSTDCHPPYGI